MKALCSIAFALLCAGPALASVAVTGPVNGATVTSPFNVTASATPCSSQSISAMGYSLDASSSTTIIKGSTLSASVTAPLGSHVLHVKSWGTGGAACTTNVNISVIQATTSPSTTDVVVSAPAAGASLTSPFSLVASGSLCKGLAITSMGYSLDASSSTTIINGTALNASVSAAAGSHTVHVKSWSKSGTACTTDVPVSVATKTTGAGPSIPATAVVAKALQNLTVWTGEHDAGTTGTSSGVMSLVTSPALSSSARRFVTNYTNYGGERYNVKFSRDQVSTNFVFETQIYLAGPSTDIGNIEMDLNQVMSNGQTVIFGFQCDIWSHTWDYAMNSGTPAKSNAHWLHSTQTCDPHKWTTNAWHHVQIEYSRDDSGYVTYKSVWLDGVEQPLNVTVLSAFALGWGPSVNINFQVDGYTSTAGSSTIYLDNLTLYSW